MTSTPAGASKSAEENKDAVANAKTAKTSGARKEAETLPQKPDEIAKQIKPTTNEGTGANADTQTAGDSGSSDGSPDEDVKTLEGIEVKRHATDDEKADPDVAVDPAGLVTEQVKLVRAKRKKKDTLRGIEDFSKLPVAVHIGQVAASVDEYSGRAILSLSLVGWVGEAPFKILAEDIDQLEDAIANLREQLA